MYLSEIVFCHVICESRVCTAALPDGSKTYTNGTRLGSIANVFQRTVSYMYIFPLIWPTINSKAKPVFDKTKMKISINKIVFRQSCQKRREASSI